MQRGFSLIEVLLSITLIGILAGLSLPVYSGYVAHNDTHITAATLAQAYRHAQTFARSGEGDSAWGVHAISGSITVFKGSSYATRDTDYDEVFSVSSALAISGLSDVVFDKLTGNPDTTGSVIISSTTGGTSVISINEKGMVQQ